MLLFVGTPEALLLLLLLKPRSSTMEVNKCRYQTISGKRLQIKVRLRQELTLTSGVMKGILTPLPQWFYFLT